jgi:hypothetical protein
MRLEDLVDARRVRFAHRWVFTLARAFRVLVVGGSAAECYLVDQPATWPHVVQEALNRPSALEALGAPAAHVGNLGRSLVTCRHIDAMLDQVFPHYDKVDAVVFMIGASDVVAWLERGCPASIPLDPLKPGQMYGQHPRGPLGQRPARVGQRQPPGCAIEQTRAEPRFEAGDRLGDRRLRQLQVFGHSGEGAQLHDLGEDRQAFEIGQSGHAFLETMSFRSFYLCFDPDAYLVVKQQRRPSGAETVR